MQERTSTYPDRGAVYGAHLRSGAVVAVQFIAVAAALWVLAWVVGRAWVILLPVVLALIVCTVLWPPVRWLRGKGVPPAAAVLLTLLVAVGVLSGVVAAVAPAIVEQSTELAQQATAGVVQVRDWLGGLLADIAPDAFHRSRYYLEYYRQTTILDELTFIAYPAAGVSLHVCLGRDAASGRPFGAREVEACQRAKMATIAGGRIEWLGVEEGDRVEAGQVLMRLWHGDLDARAAVARAQLATTRQRVNEACTVAANAEREAARQAQLMRRGFVSASAEEKAVAAARAEGRTEALTAANARLVRAEVKAAAAGVLNDPDDAVNLLNLDEFEVDEDGEVDAKAIKAAVQRLADAKPYLAAGAKPAIAA